MALPSDTDWDISYDEETMSSGAQIKTTNPLIVLQNQDYSLRRSRLLASHVFSPKVTSGGSWVTLFDAECVGPNILGTSVGSDIAGCVYARAGNASTAFSVRVYSATYGTLTATVAAGAGANAWAWRGWMTGTFTAPGDDTIWGYTVDMQVTEGTGNIYLAGVGLFY